MLPLLLSLFTCVSSHLLVLFCLQLAIGNLLARLLQGCLTWGRRIQLHWCVLCRFPPSGKCTAFLACSEKKGGGFGFDWWILERCCWVLACSVIGWYSPNSTCLLRYLAALPVQCTAFLACLDGVSLMVTYLIK